MQRLLSPVEGVFIVCHMLIGFDGLGMVASLWRSGAIVHVADTKGAIRYDKDKGDMEWSLLLQCAC